MGPLASRSVITTFVRMLPSICYIAHLEEIGADILGQKSKSSSVAGRVERTRFSNLGHVPVRHALYCLVSYPDPALCRGKGSGQAHGFV